MQLIAKTYGAAISALAAIAGVIVAAIFIVIVVDVLMRTAGLQPPSWTITYVEYGLLYFTMCSAPYLVRHKGHVVIESLVSVMPRGVQRFFEVVTYIACIGGTLIFTYQSILLLSETWISGRIDVRGVDIQMWILYFPMPLCFLIIAIEFARYLVGPDTIYSYDLTDAKDSI
ncbi:MAG: TRAP transporter small permease [Proteobacteria bacterium]|nr:TRAP transporter small permease [Pseudomonadota bacterium]